MVVKFKIPLQIMPKRIRTFEIKDILYIKNFKQNTNKIYFVFALLNIAKI